MNAELLLARLIKQSLLLAGISVSLDCDMGCLKGETTANALVVLREQTQWPAFHEDFTAGVGLKQSRCCGQHNKCIVLTAVE